MILEYHRPDTLEAALELLARPAPLTLPLGGGTVLNAPSDRQFAVVDLQKLDLAGFERKGNQFVLGATLTLQALLEAEGLPGALREAIRHEATYNTRQVATVAGALVACDGRSPFATALLALDAQLTLMPGEQEVGLGDLLPLRAETLEHRLITEIRLPTKVELAYQYVARAPADLPITCVAVAQWPSGRTRVAVGGYGEAPMMAMDGPEADGAVTAARNAYSHAGDAWASAEYRQQSVDALTRRCLELLGNS